MQNRMNIAMYLRLSKEDDRNTQESNSISCQRLLLKEYIEQNFRGKFYQTKSASRRHVLRDARMGVRFSSL